MTVTLNPLYRFDTFVVGSANRLAMTAAKAVAESPGTVYNPLFIYARPGLGKTHLLMGLGHAVRAIDPGFRSSTSPWTSSSRPFTRRSRQATARRTASASSTWICCWWTTSSS